VKRGRKEAIGILVEAEGDPENADLRGINERNKILRIWRKDKNMKVRRFK
jgi:hypothetical protein